MLCGSARSKTAVFDGSWCHGRRRLRFRRSTTRQSSHSHPAVSRISLVDTRNARLRARLMAFPSAYPLARATWRSDAPPSPSVCRALAARRARPASSHPGWEEGSRRPACASRNASGSYWMPANSSSYTRCRTSADQSGRTVASQSGRSAMGSKDSRTARTTWAGPAEGATTTTAPHRARRVRQLPSVTGETGSGIFTARATSGTVARSHLISSNSRLGRTRAGEATRIEASANAPQAGLLHSTVGGIWANCWYGGRTTSKRH